MALINTIREKMGTLVVIAVGVSILAFVIADLLGPQSTLFNDVDRTVGEIAGEEVTLEEFQAKMDELEAQFVLQNGGRNLTEDQRSAIRSQAWEALIAEKAFAKQYEALGLAVTDEEVVDMVQGNNISPELKQSFVNPETGEFDRNMLINYLQNVQNMPPQQQAMWYAYESNLRPSRKRLKYEYMLINSDYVTTAEAKREYMKQNSVAEVEYLYVPYYAVSDSAVEVTEAELEAYLQAHQDEYETEAGRSIKYVTIPIQPSAEDRELFTRELSELKRDFAAAQNDSLFALNNTEGTQAFGSYAPDQLPEELRSNINNLQEGEVYGPFQNGNNYVLYKVSEIAEDTLARAKASHILISAPEAAPEEERAAAREEAEALLKRLRNGEDFATLAREFSDDPSASRGGDLGWFTEGRMVESFNDAVFGQDEPGLVNRVVETSYGYHLINVTEPETNTVYKVAKVETELAPSQATRNQAYRQAEMFASSVEDQESFEAQVKEDSLNVFTARNLGQNERRINDMYEARPIVMWAYNENTSVGEVSEVYELEDRYVVAVLTDATEKGVASLSDVRDELIAKVKNEEKAAIIKEKLASIDAGTLEEMAAAFGPDAKVYTASDLKLGDFSLPTIGFAPKVVGTAFALEPGEVSEPLETQNGVAVVKTLAKTMAPEIADYNAYREQLQQSRSNRIPYLITEAVREAAEIEDERYKFF
ncbi:peptidylprolyl isomerase [Nafulsella turpanensis]|uniref:peptidylprolyl isomerase n=1 Tax=Nafulsella turpanensis TaxID=1265690 RepID=UPI000346BEDC|nr:peptidylprolyl isomerase [Nafulsella turpanensis]